MRAMCDLDTGRFTEEERAILQSLSPERRRKSARNSLASLDLKLSIEGMKGFEEQYRGFSEKELMARREEEEDGGEEARGSRGKGGGCRLGLGRFARFRRSRYTALF